MDYRKNFDPENLLSSAPPFEKERHPFIADYEYDEAIVLAVNVALATGRPLLVRGDAGSGKSTLAEDVARLLGRRYYEQVISSNVEAADLLYRIDHVSRIADAQAGKTDAREKPELYLDPGILFWAFNPKIAATYPQRDPDQRRWKLDDPANQPAVVLLDEIDKAEPDFPNDLLVPLGSLSFKVRTSKLDFMVEAKPELRPLVFVTTNEERDLPQAFLRRCVVLRLTVPDRTRLERIARRHFDEKVLDKTTLDALMDRYFELRGSAERSKLRPPGTAELLDAARAVVELRTDPGVPIPKNSSFLNTLIHDTMWKHRSLPEPRP
ncbi:MAG: MoxR family ATPase [Thermoanaerobaculia bacterium]|nr:MoxR family ATPase [Thermoanaerobaculia bacterium]